MTRKDGGTFRGLSCETIGSLLDAVVLGLSNWTLTCYLFQLLGLSYRHLFLASPIPFALTLWTMVKWPNDPEVHTESSEYLHLNPRFLFTGGAIASTVVAIYLFTGSYVAFWTLAVLFLVGILRMRPHTEVRLRSTYPQERVGVVVMVGLAAAALTLVAHRPDADDSFYLSLVVGAHDHPEQQVLRYDDIYGEPDLPLVEEAYRLRSYELLVAALSQGSRIPAKSLYYLFLPGFFAILVVVANWLALREIGGSSAWLGVTVTVVVLASWGDSHPCFGNFAFVRLYQGKAILVSVFVPAAIYYCSRFARNRTWRNWLLLAAVQTAAVGMSPSAIVVVPLASAAMLVAAAPASRGLRVVGEGILASAIVVGAGFLAFYMMPIQGSIPTSIRAALELVGSAGTGFDDVLGTGPRQSIAMLALLALPLVAAPGHRGRTLTRYVLALFLLVMSPVLPGVLGILTERFTWRVFWAVPFPLVLGLLAQRITTLWPGRRSIGVAVGLAIGVVFAAMPGLHTLSPDNGVSLGFPTLKVDAGHAVAQSVVNVASADDLVLAPIEVAQWIPTFPGHPRMISTRQNYLYVFGTIGWSEVEERKTLMRLVTYDWFPPYLVPNAIEDLKQRGVTLVVVPSDLPLHDVIAEHAVQLGCYPVALTCSRGVRSYSTWRCPGHD